MSARRDTEEGFAELRLIYERLLPSQRLKIARDRFHIADSIPNRIVLAVSAVEGLARVLLRAKKPSSASNEAALDVFPPRLGVPDLVKATFEAYGRETATVMDPETWQTFLLAIKMRNFLVHEAGYVNQNHGSGLLAADESVFIQLESLV